MKKTLIATIFVLFLFSFVSASISLENQPDKLYNLKDKIEVTANIIPAGEMSNQVTLFLRCDNEEMIIYKEYLFLTETTQKKVVIPLVKEYIGELNGDCNIYSKIGNSQKEKISKDFEISNELELKLQTNGEQFEPGKQIEITGTALRKNTKPANGKIEANIDNDKKLKTISEIKDGKFKLIFPIPDNFKSGTHKIELKAYEKNKNNEITNYKEETSSIMIKQLPTNIEIILDKKSVLPGEYLTGKIILRDQTGEEIATDAYVAIKDEKNNIIEKIETSTNSQFKYKIKEKQIPNTWSLAVYSEELISKQNFNIAKKEEISVNIINQTLTVENVGNIPYKKTLPVKIGGETITIETNLEVGETQKYSITAPNGKYSINAAGVEEIMMLTGNAISISEIKNTKISFIKILAWLFIIAILAIASYVLYTQAKKTTFKGKKTGKITKNSIGKQLQTIPQPGKLTTSKTKGQLVLSITGGKQNVPLGCLILKNYEELRFGNGGVKETLQQISDFIASKKGITYENKGNIFFLIPPSRTRTFENEVTTIEIANYIIDLLKEHNKKFKQKIKFGISLNYGSIVSNETQDTFKFMTMGTLVTTARKLANKSKEKLLLGKNFVLKAKDKIKVKRFNEIEGLDAYEFAQLKIKEDHSKFISNFLAKQKQ